MKPSSFLRLLILPALTAACFTTVIKAFAQTTPAADEAAPPQPPMQGRPWTPPATKLSSIIVNSIKELFDQGMADPRGCEYREVEIDPWGNGQQKIKVHAWVLPGNGKTRYAVGWNGRVNPVTSVGDPVDLRKDFNAQTHGLGQFGINRWASRDFNTLSEKQPLPIKVALLLRLGEADLAEGVWNEGYKGNGNMLANDPYSEMAREWLDSWYNRAIGAHLNGDDHLALAMFRALAPLKQKVQAAGDEHGVTGLQPGQHYLEELSQLDDLAADQERRAKEPPHVPALQADLPEGPQRIAALIRDLELVHGEQLMNPGETELTIDPIVQALVKEGEPAVEPLIACLDEDPPRMTHTLYTEGMMYEGPVEYVYEPAYVILTAILKVTITVPEPQGTNPHELPPEIRKALAAKFREYWAAHKNMSPAERWFATLQDDNATPAEWLQAATNITQPITQTSMGPNQFSGGSWWSGGSDNSVPKRGDSLRGKLNPSVGDLLIKRFNEMLPLAKGGKGVSFGAVGGLLEQIADWNGKDGVEDLRKLTRQFNETFGYVDVDFSCTSGIDVDLYNKRLAFGDPTALAEYVDWISSLKPQDVSDRSMPAAFQMMWQHPSAPGVLKAVKTMFGRNSGTWRLPLERNNMGALLNTPMLGFAPFRDQVLAELDDTGDIGYVRRWPNGNVEVHLNSDPPNDRPDAPPKTEMRTCDRCASLLSAAKSLPEFELDWPLEKRDAAIAACKAFLKQYGDALLYSPPDKNRGWPAPGFGNVQVAFPPLDHPATPEDVASGRAIFSLTGRVRLCHMPGFPLAASRPSVKYDPTHWSNGETAYTTDGYVWQAEETLVDGKWERYYGFAGRHQLEKVPASEIEFPAYGARVTPMFGARFELVDNKQVRAAGYNSYATGPGTPLQIVFKAHNRSGLDQQVPAAFMVPPNAIKTLPPAVTLHLSYSEKIAPNIANPPAQPQESFGLFGGGTPPFDYGAWSDVPLRKEITVADGKTPGPMLGADDDLTLLQIDLCDYFDMTKPGTYRFDATFQVPGGKPPVSKEYTPPATLTFTVLGKTN